MSLIPQRKKTPEELAALREKELSGQMPAAAQPEPATPAGDAVVRPPVLPRGASEHVPMPKPVRKQRRQPPLRHGTPHLFEGLRPQEAREMPVGVPAGKVSVEDAHADLPQRKHSEGEILQMRRRDMFQTRPPVEKIRNMALHPILVGGVYVLVIVVAGLTRRYWHLLPPHNWYAPGFGCGLLLVVAAFIYFRKPRARHHAAFITGVAIVILGFCLLLTFKNTHAP